MDVYDIYGTFNLLLYKEENVLRYCPGGYHPVALGDTFKDGRYQIHHKLGYGGFSTVWVAKDKELQRWVALKIMTADMVEQPREVCHLQAIARYATAASESMPVPQLLDYFVHPGPNGSHQCLVLELLGPTVNMIVSDYQGSDERLDPDVVLKFTTQLLQAVAFLHRAGYAHGDLNTRNMALSSERLSRMTQDELFQVLRSPESEALARVDGQPLGQGVPSQLVRSAEWTGWPIDEDEDEEDEEDEDIRLVDLGESFSLDHVPECLAQPPGLQAPETIFSAHFDHRVDLWRTGLMIYFFAFSWLPFGWFGTAGLVKSMMDLLGELPAEWQPKWQQLNAESDLCMDGKCLGQSLEARFEKVVHEQELQVLLPVIKGLLSFRPSDRISASEALQLLEGSKMVSDNDSDD